MEQKRLDYLDVAKGLGMILVVMSHTTEQFRYHGDLVVGFFMPLFFVASGFTYQDKGRTIVKSILHRTRQLLVPYFVYSMILYGIWYLSNRHQIDEVQCELALKGILYSRFCTYPLSTPGNTFWLIINNHPLWFLTAMYIASVVIIITVKICKKFKCMYPVFLVLFLYISKQMLNYPKLLPWSLDTAFLGAFFILTGFLFKKLFDVIGNRHWLKSVIFVPFIIMSVKLSIHNGMPNMSIREYGNWGEQSLYFFAITGVMGSIVFILLSQIIALPYIKIPFIQISKASVTILALHAVFLEWFDKLIGPHFPREPLSQQYWNYDYVKVGVTILICVLISCGWNLIVKYTMKFFSKLIKNKKNVEFNN